MVLLAVGSGSGWWIAEHLASNQSGMALSSEDGRAAARGESAATGPAWFVYEPLGRPLSSTAGASDSGEAATYDLHDYRDRPELFANLEAAGVSDQEIRYLLQDTSDDAGGGAGETLDSILPNPDALGESGGVYNLLDPQETGRILPDLGEAGVSSDEIGGIAVDAGSDVSSASSDSGLGETRNAKSYNLLDPAERAQAGNEVKEVDIGQAELDSITGEEQQASEP